MQCDLHGFEQAEAFVEILNVLKECRQNRENKIEFIHGFHSGIALKLYIQSPKFLSQMKRNGFKLIRIKAPNPGITCFQLIN
jgi:DNA-nicking Smr family endonuclease